jgi:pimeloyl-ACP methyl ester carboxylesterase
MPRVKSIEHGHLADEATEAKEQSMTTTKVSVTSKDDTAVEVSVSTYGAGRPALLLHGGAGPQSMTGFAEHLSAAYGVNALVPIHPGFGGTDRPSALTGIRALAKLYSDVIDKLDLREVTIIGNSIGAGSPQR